MNKVLQTGFEYFIDQDFNDFEEGEWVAIHERRIIAHGKELKKVMSQAEKLAPIAQVLVSKVKKTASYL